MVEILLHNSLRKKLWNEFMLVDNAMFKFMLFIMVIFSAIILGFSYLFFEKFLTEREIIITVINKERFGSEESNYLVFTGDEVFKNTNNFYHRKTNADEIYKKLERGIAYRVKVVGFYIPSINRLRNITEVVGIEVSRKDNIDKHKL